MDFVAPIVSNVANACTKSGLQVQFQVSDLTDLSSWSKIQIKINLQETNEEKASLIYKLDKSPGKKVIHIGQSGQDTKDIEVGRFYKIQLRYTNEEQSKFSEWSEVIIVKIISGLNKENFYIAKSMAGILQSVSRRTIETTTTPLFSLYCKFEENDYEYVDKFNFQIYTKSDELIEDSGWIQADLSNNVIMKHRFKTVLREDEEYYVKASIISTNGYFSTTAENYHFIIVKNSSSELEGHTLKIDSTSPYCTENACIRVSLEAEENISVVGTYILTRASEKSNYTEWEDLYYFYEWQDESTTQKYDKIIYTDYTIESGIKYKYGIQIENKYGIRSALIEGIEYDYQGNKYSVHSVDFDYSYLAEKDFQLKLKYNNKMSSFKRTQLAQKQDTLGSKYPTIMRNGYADYAEFPITGLITFNLETEDFETNLIEDNFLKERLFREKVIEFLNNGNYKIFRSPSEGNLIVGLMNVSFTPNATLGRMVYEFSATAYEVMDYNLENLNKIGLIDIKSFEEVTKDAELNKYYFVKQICGAFDSKDDILKIIKDKAQYTIKESDQDTNYMYEFKNLSYLKINVYPYISLEQDIIKATKDNNIKEINRLKELQAILPYNNPIQLLVNNNSFYISHNRGYEITSEESLKNVELIKVNSNIPIPLMIDYCYCATVKVKEEDTTIAEETFTFCDQAAGIFTDTNEVLSKYNYNWKEASEAQNTNKLIWPNLINQEDGTVKVEYEFDYAPPMVPYYFITLNIMDVIKEWSRRYVAKVLTKDNAVEDFEIGEDSSSGRPVYYIDKDGNRFYFEFIDIDYLNIEAKPHTLLLIDDSIVQIGETGRYCLNPSKNLIENIVLNEPGYVSIDFVGKILLNKKAKVPVQNGI